jgi:hypothetical protein
MYGPGGSMFLLIYEGYVCPPGLFCFLLFSKDTKKSNRLEGKPCVMYVKTNLNRGLKNKRDLFQLLSSPWRSSERNLKYARQPYQF